MNKPMVIHCSSPHIPFKKEVLMIIGDINYAVIGIVFLSTLVMVFVLPSILSFVSHGRILGSKVSVFMYIIFGFMLWTLAFSLSLQSLSSMKNYQNIDALNNHYGITISKNSNNTTTGGLSFTDSRGKLINGILVINGNKAIIYPDSSMTEYANE
jgi:hypothetical protein